MSAPTRDTPDLYDGEAHMSQSGMRVYSMPLKQYEERIKSQSKEGCNNTPLQVLQERYYTWKQVMNYMPEVKCIPTETYLLVAITSSGSSADALFPQETYKEAEHYAKDRDFLPF
jgi:hypothetical protein